MWEQSLFEETDVAFPPPSRWTFLPEDLVCYQGCFTRKRMARREREREGELGREDGWEWERERKVGRKQKRIVIAQSQTDSRTSTSCRRKWKMRRENPENQRAGESNSMQKLKEQENVCAVERTSTHVMPLVMESETGSVAMSTGFCAMRRKRGTVCGDVWVAGEFGATLFKLGLPSWQCGRLTMWILLPMGKKRCRFKIFK